MQQNILIDISLARKILTIATQYCNRLIYSKKNIN